MGQISHPSNTNPKINASLYLVCASLRDWSKLKICHVLFGIRRRNLPKKNIQYLIQTLVEEHSFFLNKMNFLWTLHENSSFFSLQLLFYPESGAKQMTPVHWNTSHAFSLSQVYFLLSGHFSFSISVNSQLRLLSFSIIMTRARNMCLLPWPSYS